MEIINWKELLYPYEQAVEELLLKFKNLDKECRHLGIYSPVDSVTGRLKTPASILDKAGRKHIAPEHIEEEIEDIAFSANSWRISKRWLIWCVPARI